MSNIEDKILDGPRVHYCDAEDDDIRRSECDVDDDQNDPGERGDASSLFVKPDEEREALVRTGSRIPGSSTNTGPKGVIEDYKKQSIVASSSRINEADIEAEFKELLDDDSVIEEHIRKRLSKERLKEIPEFGQVYRLQSGPELLDAIDKEIPSVVVIVLLYTKYSRTCKAVDRCLDLLAAELIHIKLVTLDAGVAGLSSNFKENGVPALLAYKGGELIKSLVQLEEHLDKDFTVSQIRELLVDNGLIPNP